MNDENDPNNPDTPPVVPIEGDTAWGAPQSGAQSTQNVSARGGGEHRGAPSAENANPPGGGDDAEAQTAQKVTVPGADEYPGTSSAGAANAPGAGGGPPHWGAVTPPPGGWWSPAPPGAPSGTRASLLRIPAVVALLAVGGIVGGAVGSSLFGTRRATDQSVATIPSEPNTNPDSGSDSSGAPSTGTVDANAVAAKVDPAVVDITVTLAGQGGVAKGTGMVLTSSGEVLTNNHVISDAGSISVVDVGNGRTYSASVVGYDVADDIAVLQLKGASGLKTVSIGDSSRVTVGQPVVAIGNALGQGGSPTVTQGAVTNLDQTITASDNTGSGETLSGLIQIDAGIQPGDSGGPVVDTSGKVVGMITAAQSSGRFQRSSTSTTGYAVAINTATTIAKAIESGGSRSPNVHVGARALLGVGVQDGGGSGPTVTQVQAGSGAASAGIVAGDVIISVGGTDTGSATALGAAVQTHRPGDRVQVVWLDQSGQQHSATVQLTSGPPA